MHACVVCNYVYVPHPHHHGGEYYFLLLVLRFSPLPTWPSFLLACRTLLCGGTGRGREVIRT